MLIQLGNKVYDGLFAPNTWSYSGNEASYAEHDLINGKPRLQKTGDALEELLFSFHLRAEFCSPSNEIADLNKFKQDGEILSLLLGTGEYRNDYVITEVGVEVNYTLADGTLVDATVALSLKEYVPYSKEEQAQQAARKKAFALGDKKPVAMQPGQKPTSQAAAHAELMAGIQHAWEVQQAAESAQQIQDPETLAH